MSALRATLLGALCAACDASGSLSFLAIGDWGGADDWFPTTPGEHHNNRAMGGVADRLRDVSFVLAMGDNFYQHGVADEHSSRFRRTWEDVFTHPSLKAVSWYVIAGNHDHKGNVSAQIAYSAHSERWMFPSLYYTFSKSFTAGDGRQVTVQVVYIDTVVLSGMSYRDDVTGEFVSATGPADPQLADAQLQWIEEQLRASTADYLFVSGHYPVYSHCRHGPTQKIIDNVLPLMKRYNATGYLAGHDHCLGHYESEGMVFTLSGAGTMCCYPPTHTDALPAGIMKFHMDSSHSYGAISGFASVSLNESAGTISYYDGDGKPLYTSRPFAPRRK